MKSENKCIHSNRNIRHRNRIGVLPAPNSVRNSTNYYFNVLFVLIIVICYYHQPVVGSVISFREANEEIRSELRNDRPCNFQLGLVDAHLSTPGIIEKYGYPVERHWLTTKDGYILEMHRIPSRKQSKIYLNAYNQYDPLHSFDYSDGPLINPEEQNRPAIFLMHGVSGTSRDFVINCDRRSLAFQLWESGYDVWLGNTRGNTYCRNHTSLHDSDTKFWDFSIDEMGMYDVPGMIDYILETTALKQVSMIGHSMGNGVTLIMLSLRPEYNDKINIWFAMSAAVTLKDTGSPILRIFAAFPRTIKWVLTTFNHGELIPPSLLKIFNIIAPMICRREGRIMDYHGICSIINFISDGYDPGQISPELWSVLAGGFPSPTSVKYMVQWMQWIISGDFTMFDEGPIRNLKKYGSVKPMEFPVHNLRTQTVIMWGENDWLVSPSDIRKTDAIVKRLVAKHQRETSPVEFLKIANPRWNHLDYLYGKDADVFVYSQILNRLEEIYQNQNQNIIVDSNDYESDSSALPAVNSNK